jgi:hypothetical protein
LVELDLTSLLSPSTISAFASELDRRAQSRAVRLKERQQDLEESKHAPAFSPVDFPLPEQMPLSDEVAPGEPAAAFEYPPLRASTSAVPVPVPSSSSDSAAAAPAKPAAASAWRSMSSPSASHAANSPEDNSPALTSTLSFKAALSNEPPPPKLDKLPRKNKKQVLAFSNSGARKYQP